MPRATNSTPDIRTLVESFAEQLTAMTKRMALEQVLATLESGGLGTPSTRTDATSRRTAGTRRAGRPAKTTPEQTEKMSERLLVYLKQNPGSRGEQISAALKTDTKTLRLPLQALIKAKKVKTKGQRRGMAYFPR